MQSKPIRLYLSALQGEREMKVIETAIPGVLIIEPKVFGDKRGFFTELYQAKRYAENGIASAFLQDNLSRSARNVLRGLHIQSPRCQGKLVTVLRGAVLDVAVDLRIGSPNFGQHVKVELNHENRRQLWIPRGFAHGFLVLSGSADFYYKCDEYYIPADELVIKWDEAKIGVQWGIDSPQLSPKDQAASSLEDVVALLPRFSVLAQG